jgi:hypothetical protein
MQVYFFSVEPPQIFAKTVEQAIAMLKQGGIRVIYMSKADPMIVQALQTLGVSAQQSDNPKYKVMAAI